jgi:hypothetical protein
MRKSSFLHAWLALVLTKDRWSQFWDKVNRFGFSFT